MERRFTGLGLVDFSSKPEVIGLIGQITLILYILKPIIINKA
jgi:hypothetical protein